MADLIAAALWPMVGGVIANLILARRDLPSLLREPVWWAFVAATAALGVTWWGL